MIPSEGEFNRAGGNAMERWLNRLRNQLFSPQFIISILLIIVLLYLVIGPLFGLLLRTLTWDATDIRLSTEAVPGEFTWFHWKNLLTGLAARSFFVKPLLNTIATALASSIIAVIFGGIMAWLIIRTDLPGRHWLKSLLTLTYIIPAFALALAWETLFRSPKIGGQPGLFQVLFGSPPPSWLSYGPIPITITMALHFFPFAMLIVSGALATIDSQLEEGAEILGASRWTIIGKITFPIVAPAFVASFVLTLGKTISSFALPFLLGSPVGYFTLSTMLFNSLTLGFEAQGYVMALILIIMASSIVFLSSTLLGRGNFKRFETISGKGFKGNLTTLGKWKWPLFSLVLLFVLVTAVSPIGLLLYQSLMLVDGRYGLDNLTLHYWIGHSNPAIAFGEPGVINNPVILGATWNSIRLSFISAFICAILGLVIGYIVVRNRKNLISTTLNQISFLPFLFPPIAFGAMYLSMFARQQLFIPALYGTFTLLVLISVISRLPYSTRTGTSAVAQIGQELEEIAEIQRASWFRRFRSIVFPLALPGVVSGMMVSFVGIMRELSLIILLVTPATRVLITVGFRYTEEGIVQLGNALILLVTLITMSGQLIIWWLGKNRLDKIRKKQLQSVRRF